MTKLELDDDDEDVGAFLVIQNLITFVIYISTKFNGIELFLSRNFTAADIMDIKIGSRKW